MRSRFDSIERWLGAVVLVAAVTACRPSGQTATPVMLRIEVADADADADVYVDGHYVGQARALGGGADGLGTIQLAPGVHRVEVRKAGRFPVQRTVRVDGDSPAQIELTAELLSDPS